MWTFAKVCKKKMKSVKLKLQYLFCEMCGGGTSSLSLKIIAQNFQRVSVSVRMCRESRRTEKENRKVNIQFASFIWAFRGVDANIRMEGGGGSLVNFSRVKLQSNNAQFHESWATPSKIWNFGSFDLSWVEMMNQTDEYFQIKIYLLFIN